MGHSAFSLSASWPPRESIAPLCSMPEPDLAPDRLCLQGCRNRKTILSPLSIRPLLHVSSLPLRHVTPRAVFWTEGLGAEFVGAADALEFRRVARPKLGPNLAHFFSPFASFWPFGHQHGSSPCRLIEQSQNGSLHPLIFMPVPAHVRQAFFFCFTASPSPAPRQHKNHNLARHISFEALSRDMGNQGRMVRHMVLFADHGLRVYCSRSPLGKNRTGP